MKMKQIGFLAVCVAVFGIPLAARAGEELKVGDTAPAFSLKGSDGKTYRLEDFGGKQVVVLAWFPKAFTGGCTKECTSFARDGKAMKAFGAAYFTASVDPPELNKKFAESLDADYPILSDPDGKVARAYGVVDDTHKLARRWTFIIGPNGKILAIDKQVTCQTHATDVAAALKELSMPKR